MKKNSLLFAFLFLAMNGYAQITARISDGTQFLPNAAWTSQPYYGTKGTYFADVTGDGKADAIFVGDNNITIRTSDGNSFSNYVGNKPWTVGPYYGTRGTYFADVNGDGKADAIAVGDDFVSVRLSNDNSFFNYLGNKPWTSEPYYGTRGTYFADVNGDGKADAIVVNDDLITVRISDGTQFLPNASWTQKPFYGTKGTYFADVNGDGKADAIAVNDDKVTVYRSNGNSFFNYLGNKPWTSEPYYGTRGTYFADVNGDGKADAIVVNDNLVTVRISTGTQFLPNASWTTEPYYGNQGIYFADANGDGKADAIVVNASGGQSAKDDITDSDEDGITDEIESQLLTRFRPYYKFSLDDRPDSYHPTDALWFVQNSTLKVEGGTFFTQQQLADNPGLLLTAYGNADGSADYKVSQQKTGYQLDLPDELQTGEPDWNVIQSKAVGLYGHVRPLKENRDVPGEITAYIIEFWQFYAFNDAITATYRHEGDWENVRLIVEADLHTIRTIIHSIHSGQVVFNISQGNRVDMGNDFIEYQGTGSDKPYRGLIELSVGGPAGIDRAQDNLVRLYCSNGECTHPVVYIEHSGHASWPTEYWEWIGARKHNGDDIAYLVNTPPNLGEFDHPNPQCPGAALIMHFSGSWGGSDDSPPSPTLQSWAH